MPRKKELTAKQKRFVAEYLIDLNSTKAAVRSGYSEKTADKIGPELLTKPAVQEEIERQTADQQKRTEITADRVLRQLAKQGFADITDFLEWDRDGNVTLKPSAEVDGTLVTEITQTVTDKGATLRFKRTDPQKALEMIGKHLAMFTEKKELSGPGGNALEVVFVDPEGDE